MYVRIVTLRLVEPIEWFFLRGIGKLEITLFAGIETPQKNAPCGSTGFDVIKTSMSLKK